MEAMEIVESSVEPIQYPDMRAEVVEAVRALSDPDYQHRVWIRHEYPRENFYDDFTTNVNILFDDVCVLPEPQDRVGVVLHPGEVETMRALGEVLEPLIDQLGDASDARYLEHPQWPTVIDRARRAYGLLSQNDSPRLG